MLKKDFLLDQLMIESFGQECNILKEDGFLKMSTRIFMIIYSFLIQKQVVMDQLQK